MSFNFSREINYDLFYFLYTWLKNNTCRCRRNDVKDTWRNYYYFYFYLRIKITLLGILFSFCILFYSYIFSSSSLSTFKQSQVFIYSRWARGKRKKYYAYFHIVFQVKLFYMMQQLFHMSIIKRKLYNTTIFFLHFSSFSQ